MAVTVIAVSPESITLDGNHPLAGKDLTFEIQLVEILSLHFFLSCHNDWETGVLLALPA